VGGKEKIEEEAKTGCREGRPKKDETQTTMKRAVAAVAVLNSAVGGCAKRKTVETTNTVD